MLGAAALALALGHAGAASVDAEGRIVLTAEEVRACNAGGGCMVIPAALVMKLLDLAEKGAAMKCGANWKGTA